MIEVVQEPETFVHGDYVIQAETGEILGLARDAATEPPFRVNSRSEAEWVLEKLTEAESEIAALDKRKAVLISNIEAMQREHEHRAQWLRVRFGPELEEWARTELAGKKTRTLKTPFGTLSFRKRPEKLVVDEEEKAIAWADKWGITDAIKRTEKLLISMIPPDKIPDGCHIEPEQDRFRIDTGMDV
jgi:hypothetical protein